MTSTTRTRSRLSKIALFYHTGNIRSLGFTASFRPLLVRFTSKKRARALPKGWYMLNRSPYNMYVVVRSGKELTPLTFEDLEEVSRRMRIRFTKLVNRVTVTKKRRFGDIHIVPMRDVPHIAGEAEYVLYVAIGDYVTLEALPQSRFLNILKEHVDDRVVLYAPRGEAKIAGVFHFLS